MARADHGELFRAIERGDEKAVRRMLDAGAPADARDYVGCSALTRAVQKGHVPIVRLLLDRGAPAGRTRRGEYPPIFGALRHERTELLEMLLAAGANPKALGHGETAVMAAASRGQLELVKRLIGLGVDPHAVCAESHSTARDMAEGRHPEVARYLASLGVPELQAPFKAFVQHLVRRFGGKAQGGIINPKSVDGARTQVVARRDGYTLALLGKHELSPDDIAALGLGEGDGREKVSDGVLFGFEGLDAELAAQRLAVLQRVGSRSRDTTLERAPAPRFRIALGRKLRSAPAPPPPVHLWGGRRESARACASCGTAQTLIARFNLRDPVFAPWALTRDELEITWCLDCGDWGPFVDPPLGKARRPIGEAELDLPLRRISLVAASRSSRSASFVGGEPAWLQEDATPTCARCKREMRFLLQVTGGRDLSFGDLGTLYAFACAPCGTFTTLVQSH